MNKNGQTKPSALSRRETLARARGYSGKFPPPPVTINSADDYRETLHKLTDGERRAAFIDRLGSRAIAFCSELEPDDFRTLAQQLIEICADPKTAPRSRLRAIQAALKPVTDGVKVIEELLSDDGTDDCETITHLVLCLTAFLDELEASDYRSFARDLLDLAKGGGASSAGLRVRAVETVMRQTSTLAATLMRLQSLARNRKENFEHYGMSSEKYAAAQAELQTIMDGINQKIAAKKAAANVTPKRAAE